MSDRTRRRRTLRVLAPSKAIRTAILCFGCELLYRVVFHVFDHLLSSVKGWPQSGWVTRKRACWRPYRNEILLIATSGST